MGTLSQRAVASPPVRPHYRRHAAAATTTTTVAVCLHDYYKNNKCAYSNRFGCSSQLRFTILYYFIITLCYMYIFIYIYYDNIRHNKSIVIRSRRNETKNQIKKYLWSALPVVYSQ